MVLCHGISLYVLVCGAAFLLWCDIANILIHLGSHSKEGLAALVFLTLSHFLGEKNLSAPHRSFV